MGCQVFKGDGFTAIACTRGGRPKSARRKTYCADCLAEGARVEATKLCDGPPRAVTGRLVGLPGTATCDRGMCDRHVAARPTPETDLCSRCAPGVGEADDGPV